MVLNLNRLPSFVESAELFWVKHMTDIYWIKFYEQDGTVECFCLPGRKKCPVEKKPLCKEYVVKFTKIQRNSIQEEADNLMNVKLKRSVVELEKVLRRRGIKL